MKNSASATANILLKYRRATAGIEVYTPNPARQEPDRTLRRDRKCCYGLGMNRPTLIAAARALAIAAGAAGALVMSSPSFAQPAPTGIAFAQAEEGTWWCRDETPAKALACAVDKCREKSAGQECHATRWCLPAGWSGLMTVWLPEFHATTIVCGTSGETAVIAALKAICDASPFVTRCTPFAIIEPDGTERGIDDLDWPGPAIRNTDAPADTAQEPAQNAPLQ